MKKLVGTILMVCIATMGYSQGAAGLAKKGLEEGFAKILGEGATSATRKGLGGAVNKATTMIAIENEVLNGTRGVAHSKINGVEVDEISNAVEAQVLQAYNNQLSKVRGTHESVPYFEGTKFTEDMKNQIKAFARLSNITEGYIAKDYASFIPSAANILYLGKGGTSHTREHILRLMTQYRKQHPNRNIYLAVESIYAEAPFAADAQQLDEVLDYLHGYSEQEFMIEAAAQMLDMKIVGLESLALFNKKLMEFNFNRNKYLDWESSPEGLAQRNQAWADQINKVFEQDKKAVVFVLGSKQNLMLTQPNAVPKLVKGQKPFTIMFSAPPVKTGKTPHFYSMVSPYWRTLMNELGPQQTPLRFAVFKDRKQAAAFGGQMMVEVAPTNT